MKKNMALPSKYLNGADIGMNLYKLVIKASKGQEGPDSVVLEMMENDRTMKPVMYFDNAEKGLVVNNTNWDNMADVFGDESTSWVGKTIEMYTEATRTPAGQPTRGVRIRPVAGPDTAAQFAGVGLPAPVQAGTSGSVGGKVNTEPAGPGEKAVEVAKAGMQSIPTDPVDLDDEIPF